MNRRETLTDPLELYQSLDKFIDNLINIRDKIPPSYRKSATIDIDYEYQWGDPEIVCEIYYTRPETSKEKAERQEEKVRSNLIRKENLRKKLKKIEEELNE